MHRERRAESGAAAVEFALVSGVLFLVLFGILQYGLFFNDSLNARQGVREAVRQGVVKNFSGGTGATDMAKLASLTSNQVNAITGPTYVKVIPPSPWKKGSPLIICAMVKSNGAIGLLPMPDHGWITTKTQMSVEQDTPVPTGATISPVVTGHTWDWCA